MIRKYCHKKQRVCNLEIHWNDKETTDSDALPGGLVLHGRNGGDQLVAFCGILSYDRPGIDRGLLVYQLSIHDDPGFTSLPVSVGVRHSDSLADGEI